MSKVTFSTDEYTCELMAKISFGECEVLAYQTVKLPFIPFKGLLFDFGGPASAIGMYEVADVAWRVDVRRFWLWTPLDTWYRRAYDDAAKFDQCLMALLRSGFRQEK